MFNCLLNQAIWFLSPAICCNKNFLPIHKYVFKIIDLLNKK